MPLIHAPPMTAHTLLQRGWHVPGPAGRHRLPGMQVGAVLAAWACRHHFACRACVCRGVGLRPQPARRCSWRRCWAHHRGGCPAPRWPPAGPARSARARRPTRRSASPARGASTSPMRAGAGAGGAPRANTLPTPAAPAATAVQWAASWTRPAAGAAPASESRPPCRQRPKAWPARARACVPRAQGLPSLLAGPHRAPHSVPSARMFA